MSSTCSSPGHHHAAQMKLCECGCGEHSPVAAKTGVGYTKGDSKRFISGHNARLPESRQRMADLNRELSGERHYAWRGESASYGALHHWVAKRKIKTGVCSRCHKDVGVSKNRGTHWANISGEYKRDLDDYAEMCVPCHKRYDLSR